MILLIIQTHSRDEYLRCPSGSTHIHIVGIDVVSVFGVLPSQRPQLHPAMVIWGGKTEQRNSEGVCVTETTARANLTSTPDTVLSMYCYCLYALPRRLLPNRKHINLWGWNNGQAGLCSFLQTAKQHGTCPLLPACTLINTKLSSFEPQSTVVWDVWNTCYRFM